MIKSENCVFMLVDVQGKLADVMHDRDALFDNLQRLVKGMQALRIPILWIEQIPAKMGPTIPQLAELLVNGTPIHKSCFSCCGNDEFTRRLTQLGRQQVILAGIEAHVCIYQTAVDLLEAGLRVEVVADAVSSRVLSNKLVALDRIKTAGAGLTSVETILFELMRTAEHPAFRDVLKIVR